MARFEGIVIILHSRVCDATCRNLAPSPPRHCQLGSGGDKASAGDAFDGAGVAGLGGAAAVGREGVHHENQQLDEV
jgi:hypothetical protein